MGKSTLHGHLQWLCYWLVVFGCHEFGIVPWILGFDYHPNWLIFFRGVAQPPTRWSFTTCTWFWKTGPSHNMGAPLVVHWILRFFPAPHRWRSYPEKSCDVKLHGNPRCVLVGWSNVSIFRKFKVPSGKLTVRCWTWPSRNSWLTHKKIWCSIFVLHVYQRVLLKPLFYTIFDHEIPNRRWNTKGVPGSITMFAGSITSYGTFFLPVISAHRKPRLYRKYSPI